MIEGKKKEPKIGAITKKVLEVSYNSYGSEFPKTFYPCGDWLFWWARERAKSKSRIGVLAVLPVEAPPLPLLLADFFKFMAATACRSSVLLPSTTVRVVPLATTEL